MHQATSCSQYYVLLFRCAALYELCDEESPNCGTNQFCAIACFTSGCKLWPKEHTLTLTDGFCQPCTQCTTVWNSVTGSCEVCDAASKLTMPIHWPDVVTLTAWSYCFVVTACGSDIFWLNIFNTVVSLHRFYHGKNKKCRYKTELVKSLFCDR